MIIAYARVGRTMYRIAEVDHVQRLSGSLPNVGMAVSETEMPTPRDGAFAQAVRARVARQLAGAPAKGGGKLWGKAAVIGCWFVVSYGTLLAAPSLIVFLGASLSFAFASAALAFNVFHDANHGAFCASKRTNLWLARLCCVALGVGRRFWHHKHHVLHHSFPNVFQWDDDVESRGFLRLSPLQPWQPRYRGQHLYCGVLYALNSVEWIFIKDFVQYFRLRINPFQSIPKLTLPERAEFWLCKAAYAALFLIPPLLVQPFGWVAAGFVLFHLVMSVLLTVVFQLAHLNDAVAFPAMEQRPRSDGWAAHQMRTTANFAMRSPAINWFTGGLNFQIEHHLFPHVSHTRYPEISATVREVAGRFGLPYVEYASLTEAVAAHIRLLRTLGRRDEAVPLQARTTG
jgi:linoleoyl-CoA desaturase